MALVALIMATQALAIDSMLPALPAIAQSLSLGDPNWAQATVTAYIVGNGLGQLFWGPLADRFGRRRILLIGLAGYAVAGMLCVLVRSFTAFLVLRLLHGASAASAVVCRSLIRDLYSGRRMARVMSLTFIVFLIVPVLAPTIGQLVLSVGNWRSIFTVMSAFGLAMLLWAAVRLPETLHPEYRMTLTWPHLRDASRLILTNRASIGYTLAMTTLFGALLAYVGMVQQIFADIYGQPAMMPRVFALCSAGMAVAAFFNSRLVERLGTRRISHAALLGLIAMAGAHLVLAWTGRDSMWAFTGLQAIAMALFALSASNFGAMAMEPLGAIAGIGASLQGFISTAGGGLIGALIGQQFDGTTRPLMLGALVSACMALGFVLYAEEGRLFRPHHAQPSADSAPAMH